VLSGREKHDRVSNKVKKEKIVGKEEGEEEDFYSYMG
jgi:hypothetical protein